ncbi:hypothetical protein [Curtobacterium sp. MCSS17_007]|uniref:hypothetical protein n=1 Tax=Curtobacterium sp. MCSS17_007 TaxID=2175646 RepID=UPI000DAA030C|nr:hypothetical protein [Curtobacterium sp. MCSS17_007]WIE74495.1 hypothetical protein DEJ22_009390 [Curtobacterium sp. MCSS17_007]
MPNIRLGPKQLLAFNVLNDPFVVDLLFGGGAGGGKSLLVTMWAAIECRKFPGITIGLGRKEISNLGKTTVATLLTEAHLYLGIGKDDFTYKAPGSPNPGIYYKNGSAITLHDLAYAPSDPNYDRFGSLPLTHAIIEEIGELDERAVRAFASRVNRKLNREYDITGKTIQTCNPSQNFAREQYYDVFERLGGGDMQSWPRGDVWIGGKLYVDGAKRVFIKSLPTDNPFLPRNYIETLRSLPPAQRRRLLEGDWDFDQDEGKLIASHKIRTTDDFDRNARSAFGCDPSRGGDGCIFTELKGGVVVDSKRLEIPQDDPHFDVDTFIAQEFIDWVQSRGGGYEDAAIDAVGIGSGVLDACNRLGFYVQAFIAGSTVGIRVLDKYGVIIDDPTPAQKKDSIALFNNIRSQNYSDIATDLEKGTLLFFEDVPHLQEYKKDLSAHKVKFKERQTIIESKPELKLRLGRSPDYSDALLAAYWVDKNRPQDFAYESPKSDDEDDGGFRGTTMTGGLLNKRF